MIKHVWTVLCKETVIDQESNNISIFDALEQIVVEVDNEPIYPINVQIMYEIASLWIKSDQSENAESEVVINITDPDNNIVKTFNQTLSIPKNLQRMRTRTKISGIVVTSAGLYHFNIKIKNKSEKEFTNVAEIPLLVQVKKISKVNPPPLA